MRDSEPTLKSLLLLKLVCCGLPLLLVAVLAAGGLAGVGAWLGKGWPLLLGLAILVTGVVLWRRRVASCSTCALPGPRGQEHAHRPAGLSSTERSR